MFLFTNHLRYFSMFRSHLLFWRGRPTRSAELQLLEIIAVTILCCLLPLDVFIIPARRIVTELLDNCAIAQLANSHSACYVTFLRV
jgi:hypothetical protein